MEVSLHDAKTHLSRLIEADWDILLPRELKKSGVLKIDLEATDCRKMEDLPLHHRDPFDRMLIAQALRRRLGVISRDSLFDEYPVLRAW